MTFNKRCFLLIGLIAQIAFSLNLQAGEFVTTQRLYGNSSIVKDAELKLFDNAISDLSEEAYRKKYTAQVTLSYARYNRSDVQGANWCLSVEYKIEFQGESSVAPITGNKLTISSGANPVYEGVHIFTQTEKSRGQIKVTITNVDATQCGGVVPEDIVLELSLKEDNRFYLPSEDGFEGGREDNRIYWSYCQGAESYDLEWVYIDAKSGITITNAPSAFAQKEPVRINTSLQYYDLNLTYPAGRVYYRIRGVGNYLSEGGYTSKYTDWLYPSMQPIVLDLPFEAKHNWQYTTSYAEQGKYKKVITYYDGTLRTRQIQTNISSDSTVVVGETHYDYEGRGVVDVLPVPIKTSSLSFKENFTSFSNGKATYDTDFDDSFGAVHTVQQPLQNTSEASKYYSDQNTVETINRHYIPQAEGHVYTLSQYMEDGTGRLWRQSGVGNTFGLKDPDLDGHYTRYLYGTPTNTELHRLFGSNVGKAIHYQKNAVIDPNGQVSISYLDQKGRVIATALAGNTPTNLQALDSNTPEILTVNLDGSNYIDRNNFVSTSVNKVDNVVVPTSYQLLYSMNGIINTSDDFYGVCETCTYDLKITLLDEKGMPVVAPIIRNNIRPSSYNCNEDFSFAQDNLVDTTVTFNKIGIYTITKTLTLSGGHLETLLQNITSMTGYPDSSAYIAAALAAVDTSMCVYSCEEHCLEEIFRAHPSWRYTTDPVLLGEIEMLKEACVLESPCANSTKYEYTCTSLLLQMKEQLSPGGVYYGDLPSYTRSISKGWTSAPPIEDIRDPDLFRTQNLLLEDAWINNLVKGHIEYCHYEACVREQLSADYDLRMASVVDWGAAYTKGYLNPLNTTNAVARDPFYYNTSVNPSASTYKTLMQSELTNYAQNNGLSMYLFPDVAEDPNTQNNDLWDFVSNYRVYGESPSYIPSSKEKWELFHAIYLGIKQKHVMALRAASSCLYSNEPHAVVENPANTLITDIGELKEKVEETFLRDCVSNEQCNQTTNVWMKLLTSKCKIETDSIFGGDSVLVAAYLQQYCKSTCIRNPLNLMIKEDIASEPMLIAAETILQRNNCSLEYIAVPNPYIVTCYPVPDSMMLDLPTNPLARMMPPPSGIDTICVVTGLITCDDILEPVEGSCPDDNIDAALTSCTYNIVAGINKIIRAKKEATYDNIGCFDEDEWEADKVLVSDGVVQLMQTVRSGCNSYGQGNYILLADQPGTTTTNPDELDYGFALFVSNDPVQYPSNNYCEPNSEQLHPSGSALNQNLMFYTWDGIQKKYIAHHEMLQIGIPYIDCNYLNSGVEDLASSFGIAVEIQVEDFDNVPGIRTVKAYMESSGFVSSPSSVIWKVVPDAPAASFASLCHTTVVIDPEVLRKECIAQQVEIATTQAIEQWEKDVQRFQEEVVKKYYNQCFQHPFGEQFSYRYSHLEYHYTLYYYDQADNLIQTVPPAGVNPLKVDAFDETGNYLGSKEPYHYLITKYRYNSLNQLIWQKTPDAGEAVFLYDSRGQLRLSQNAQQKADSGPATNRYSYTTYDHLGRIEEVGEYRNYEKNSTYLFNKENYKDLMAILSPRSFPASVSGAVLYDKIRTYYDEDNISNGNAANLRGRVRATQAFDANYAYPVVSTYYVYDPHGNVKSMMKEIDGGEMKLLYYDYDLISNNVRQVSQYNMFLEHPYLQRYTYDADNRITSVSSSLYGVQWQEDARYFYYKHGPLARMELGQDNVQGLDYYYTLQGWLKGVNVPSPRHDAKVTADPGHDGIALGATLPYQGGTGYRVGTNLHRYVAQDAFAYTLGYFDGDYAPINTQGKMGLGHNSVFSTSPLGSTILADRGDVKGLFNGNIAYMTTQVHDLAALRQEGEDEHVGIRGSAFRYDQLNRLTEVRSYAHQTSGTAGFVPRDNTLNTGAFDARYFYDANGNITQTKINGATSALMDDLTYRYDTYVDAADNNRVRFRSNRLYHVNDAVSTPQTDDLEDQGAFTASASTPYILSPSPGVINTANNYRYDAIGNLIHDASEEIESIEWTPSGKVRAVIRSTGSSRTNLRFVYDATGQRVKKIATPAGGGPSVITYYYRDASGNVLETQRSSSTEQSREYTVYGSSRVGIQRLSGALPGSSAAPYLTNSYEYRPDNKEYELANHLGNVYLTLSGLKLGYDTTSDGRSDYYGAAIRSALDYYAFGMSISARTYNSSDYRYGFNGKENDNETGWQDYGMRMYNPKLNRFFTVDPITAKYPELTPYQFASNRPIDGIDLDGLEYMDFSVITKLFEMAGITKTTATEVEKKLTVPAPVYPSWEGNSKPTFGIQFYGDGETVENKKDVPVPGAKIVPADKALIDGLAKRNSANSIKLKSDPNNSSDSKGSNSNKSGGIDFNKPGEKQKFEKGLYEKATGQNAYKMGTEYNQQQEPETSFTSYQSMPNQDGADTLIVTEKKNGVVVNSDTTITGP
jgi:RHS repeat-associated protein